MLEESWLTEGNRVCVCVCVSVCLFEWETVRRELSAWIDVRCHALMDRFMSPKTRLLCCFLECVVPFETGLHRPGKIKFRKVNQHAVMWFNRWPITIYEASFALQIRDMQMKEGNTGRLYHFSLVLCFPSFSALYLQSLHTSLFRNFSFKQVRKQKKQSSRDIPASCSPLFVLQTTTVWFFFKPVFLFSQKFSVYTWAHGPQLLLHHTNHHVDLQVNYCIYTVNKAAGRGTHNVPPTMRSSSLETHWCHWNDFTAL